MANVEAGRKNLGDTATYRLLALDRHRPPPHGRGPLAPDFSAPDSAPTLAPDFLMTPDPAEASELAVRRWLQRLGRVYGARWQLELDQFMALARQQARRRWVLATLRQRLAEPLPLAPTNAQERLLRLVVPSAALPDPVANLR